MKTQMPKTQVCIREVNELGKTERQARKPLSKFSPKKDGGYHPICKACRCALSNGWTTKRADYRKLYHQALQVNRKAGKTLVRVPTAKTYKSGDKLRFASNGAVYKPKAARASTIAA